MSGSDLLNNGTENKYIQFRITHILKTFLYEMRIKKYIANAKTIPKP